MPSTSTPSFHAQIAEAFSAASTAYERACEIQHELLSGRSFAVQCGDEQIPCRVISYRADRCKYDVEVALTDVAAMLKFGKPYFPSHVDKAWFDVAPQFLVDVTEGGAA